MVLVLIVFVLANMALLVPVAIFATEVLASLTSERLPEESANNHRPSVAIIVPAHEEADGIGKTVAALISQLRPGDRLLVVADNCTDETARRAREAGAEVVERSDPIRRGKGYALDFGVRHMERSPSPIVIIIDADCTMEAGAVDRLAAAAAATGRPVQGRNLMTVPPEGRLDLQVAEFAFLVKNLVRPTGLSRLGLPCHLTGTGMALPWHIVRNADLAHASLVEDMKLGLDLAFAGTPAFYSDSARINSYFPYSDAGAASQRSRWEEGHVGMIALALRHLPSAIAARNIGAIALALDIVVPPLTLLVLLISSTFMITGIATFTLGLPSIALWISAATLIILAVATLVAWYCYGRKALPARSLLRVVPYILGKLKLYRGLASGARSGSWIRTDRKGPDA